MQEKVYIVTIETRLIDHAHLQSLGVSYAEHGKGSRQAEKSSHCLQRSFDASEKGYAKMTLGSATKLMSNTYLFEIIELDTAAFTIPRFTPLISLGKSESVCASTLLQQSPLIGDLRGTHHMCIFQIQWKARPPGQHFILFQRAKFSR